jgi:ABC-type sulfate transport system permease subunit
MRRTAILIGVCVLISVMPTILVAGSLGTRDSASRTAMIHEENSVLASVLYIPVTVLSIPVRIVHGILYPWPTTQSTSPPAVHRAPRR